VLELDASGLGCEAPVGLGVVLVAVFDPGGDLTFEGVFIWNAAIKASACRLALNCKSAPVLIELGA
jgi:hypothetical protein